MLIGNGLSGEGIINSDIEIIDLKNSKSVCQNFPTFPIKIFAAFGGMAVQNFPFICGGLSYTTNSYSNACYYYQSKAWNMFLFPMPDKRGFSTVWAPSSDPQSLVVIGGRNETSEFRSVAKLSSAGWAYFLPMLPTTLNAHCSVLVNQISLFVIGGKSNVTLFSSKTYVLNYGSSNWMEGPPLITGRYGHSCSRIRKNSQDISNVTIVVGGWIGSYSASVEILDDGATAWRNGPSLPYGILYAILVQDQDGGVVLAGGGGPGNNYLNTLFRLSNGGDNWVFMTQRLKTGQHLHVGFLVPDFMTNCTSN